MAKFNSIRTPCGNDNHQKTDETRSSLCALWADIRRTRRQSLEKEEPGLEAIQAATRLVSHITDLEIAIAC